MNLLSPAWLFLALLAIPILILYMLKLRRREVQVSSTLLWQMLMRDRQANAPWQRIKRSLLLFLQLFILGALVFALTRPAIPVPGVTSAFIVVILDASASMNAQDGAARSTGSSISSRTRFEAAREMVGELIDSLPGSSRMTLILAAYQPQTLVSAEENQAELHQALEIAQPSQGTTDWETTFTLAAGAASAALAEETTILVVTDGGLPSNEIPPLPGEVHYLPVGQQDENLAVSALALRPAGDQPELFASITNYGQSEKQFILSFYADEKLLQAQQLTLPGGQTQNIILDNLPAGSIRYEARLSPASQEARLDLLPLDDAAFAVYQPDQSRRILLASSGNIFLEQLLTSLPGIQPFRALPTEGKPLILPDERFDLYIFDGLLPADLPSSNLLILNPPPNELFQVNGVFTPTSNVQVIDHPLTEFVDWDNVHIRQAQLITPPEWADILIRAEDGPLVLAGENGRQRVGLVAFDLHDSDLPLQVAYPILFSNLINYLAPLQTVSPAAASSLQPGNSLTIQPIAGVNQAEVITPSGQVVRLDLEERGGVFSATRESGFYSIHYLGLSETKEETFAVNLFNPLESQINPAQTINVGRTRISTSAEAAVGQRELWPWLAILALGFLLLEWGVYHRRQSLPANWLSRIRASLGRP